METKTATTATAQSAPIAEKMYIENTLLRVAGALFCHDQKQAAKRIAPIELNPGVAEKSIVVRPHPEFGQPGPLAHKIFVALIKKHSDYGRPVQSDIAFSKRELMRLIGRESWGGRDSEQLVRALNEIHHTFIQTGFKRKDGGFTEHSFAIFPEVIFERAEHATDPIESCVVTLAKPIIASLEDDHFTCLNHALMRCLGTIGQALMMRTFFHMASLYDGHHKTRLTFSKRYDAICSEWLGGLTVLPYASMIEREQLGPHLRQLVQERFLASYAIAKAKNGNGFVVTFRPGATFFADYDRFYRHRNQGGLQFEFHADRQSVAEPVKVAHLFLEKRSGQKLKAVPYVSTKEVETARHLLRQIPFDAMPGFIGFALGEAKKTKFDVQSLGGLRQYVTPYLNQREAHRAGAAATKVQSLRKAEDDLRRDYDRFRRERADAVYVALSETERRIIGELATQTLPAVSRGRGSIAAIMVAGAKAKITAERYPDRIPTFDAWRAAKAFN